MAVVLDLSSTSVFFDFDGTISTRDIGVHLLERLASDDWRALDQLYCDGLIGSRECMRKQWACIPASVGESQRKSVAAEVPLDAAFGPLLERLRLAGAEVTVVSDGFGYYVHDLLAPFGVAVVTNDVDFVTNSVRFPNADATCAGCAACGTCKPKVVQEAAARGRATVFVGDGTSDRHAAIAADVVFAKAALATWCAAEGVTHTPFRTLADVGALLFP